MPLPGNEAFSAVLVDIMMPKMNGYELIREIRAFSDVPILILSAKNEDNDKILGLNIGADDYITKPFNPLEMTAPRQRRRPPICRRGQDGGAEAEGFRA